MGNLRLSVFALLLSTFLLSGDAGVGGPTDYMFLRLYRGNLYNYTNRVIWDAAGLVPFMNNSISTVLLVHDWMGNVVSPEQQALANAYLECQDVNVLLLDWRALSMVPYPLAVTIIMDVSTAAARALDSMVAHGWNNEGFRIVGYLVGSHLAGYIGRRVSFRVSTIVGLSPAGPMFEKANDHLSASDADFVTAIHTSAGIFSTNRMITHADFRPNGGSKQPACQRVGPVCDEAIAWEYYAESVCDSAAFLAVRCDNPDEFQAGNCNPNDIVIMGHDTPATARGQYFLRTAAASPYGLGLAGLEPSVH